MWALFAIPFFWACSSRPVRTIENLRNLAASERNAAVRYRSCSVRAREEGYRNIANLFAALACSEEVHAELQMRMLNRYGERVEEQPLNSALRVELTRGNLKVSLRMERYEALTAFPIFEQAAATEGEKEAERLFRRLREMAARHGEYCRRTLEKLDRDSSDSNVVNSWSVCPQCGAMYETVTLQDNCAMCELPASSFLLFQ